MELWLLKPGHKIRTKDGNEAEVLSETEDGAWIRVRYLEVRNEPSLAGTEDLVTADEVEVLLGVARRKTWADRVTVILHHIPESEESEENYEAVTMTGVPENVSITASDSDSAEEALNTLIAGLRAFGFSGRVAVEDATHDDGMRRYEVEAS